MKRMERLTSNSNSYRMRSSFTREPRLLGESVFRMVEYKLYDAI